jgi:hypothetical protein
MRNETQPISYEKPDLVEKGAWWTKVTGFVVALIASVNHWACVFVAGVTVSTAGEIAHQEYHRARTSKASS